MQFTRHYGTIVTACWKTFECRQDACRKRLRTWGGGGFPVIATMVILNLAAEGRGVSE